MPKEKPFPRETDLCAAFLEHVDKRVWVPYAETEGWDILLSRKCDGFQIGVHAKLKIGTEVINQAIRDLHYNAGVLGPDCRAVLVPDPGGFSEICKFIGIELIYPRHRYGSSKWAFNPSLPDRPGAHTSDWPEWAPMKRHKLPEYVPDVPAGASGPIQLTEWKIKALKLAVLMAKNGAVTRADFRALHLDCRRWLDGRWMVITPEGLKPGPAWPNFQKMHPRVYGQIEADFPKWGAALEKSKGLFE